jgi:hypothetical protein
MPHELPVISACFPLSGMRDLRFDLFGYQPDSVDSPAASNAFSIKPGSM